MISEKRILAARANGARSRGPKTPQGKARSSRNATRHGLTSKSALIHDEPPETLQSLLDSYVQRFQPRDPVERGLVEVLVASRLRLRRIWAMETSTLEARDKTCGAREDSLAAAFADPAVLAKLAVLNRYEAHHFLVERRALHELVALRKCAVRNEPKKSFISNTSPQIGLTAEPTLAARGAPHRERDPGEALPLDSAPPSPPSEGHAPEAAPHRRPGVREGPTRPGSSG
jgi:hypothetical protein